MKFDLSAPPFYIYVTLQIISFLFLLMPGIMNLPPSIGFIFILLEIVVLGLGFFHIFYQKKTKKLFFIFWESLFFIYIVFLLLFQPEQTLAEDQVSFLTVLTLIFFLSIMQVFLLVYVIFQEKAITKLLFSLAFSTSLIVLLIVVFVMLEGIPAFYENDPIEFITGTEFHPSYRIDVTETVKTETSVHPQTFEIDTQNQIYIQPGNTDSYSIEILNRKKIPQSFSLIMTSDLPVTLDQKQIELEGKQSIIINYNVTADHDGIFPLEFIIQSDLNAVQQQVLITCHSVYEGISLNPKYQEVDIKKDEEIIQVPLFFKHFGNTSETYKIEIDTTDSFIPSILGMSDWDFDTSSGTVTFPANQTFRLFLNPGIIRLVEGMYYLNITITSLNNPDLSNNATVLIDYVQNQFVVIQQSKKDISKGDTATYQLNFSKDLYDDQITITSELIEGNAIMEIYYQNKTYDFHHDNKVSFLLTRSFGNIVYFNVTPIPEFAEENIIELEVISHGTEPQFGVFPFIFGTILTTFIAILIAAPMGVAIAIFLAEFVPSKIRKILRPLYELLAGIPSVLYGLWGFLTFGPLLGDYVYPFIANTLGEYIPLFAARSYMGRSVLTASVVLSIMILPIIITLSEDAIRSVSKSLKEGSLAMGATRWQTMRHIIVPKAKSGIISSIILGTGRAIGETMAVLMIMGSIVNIPTSLFEKTTTMTGVIASTFQALFALDKSRHALFAIGTILFIMVFGLNVIIIMITRSREGTKKDNRFFRFNKKRNNTNESKHKQIKKPERKFMVLDEKNSIAVANRKKFMVFDEEGNQNSDNSIHRIKNVNKNQYLKKHSHSMKKDSKVKKIILASTKKALFHQKITTILLLIAAVIASFFLFYILGDILVNGGTSIQPEFFFEIEKAGGKAGGYLNAILGSLYLIVIALLLAAPLSIGAAIYVEEYAKTNNIFTKIIMFTSDTLASTPSIVFGAFGFMLFVLYLDFGYSLFAGGITLGFMIIPLMLRSSIEAIKAIPHEFQEGALALGVTKWESIKTVVLPPAAPGIISGVIISMGRAIGETAAVLLTAGYATSIPGSPLHAAASMPNLIYKNYTQTGHIPILGEKVYSAAFVLIIIVLLLNFIARLFSVRGERMMKG